MQLVDANPEPQIAGQQELSGRINYFTGNDSLRWHRNVPTYARVEYQEVYPGVDLVYYGNQRELEYDLIVASGSNPDVIKLSLVYST